MKRKTNVFQDKRKVKKGVGDEEQRVRRWYEERSRHKKDKFNLGDDDAEEVFTHGGVALSNISMGYTDVPKGILEEDEEEGEVFNKLNTQKTTKDRYKEMIENSKQRKQEKAIERQEQNNRLDFLNNTIEDIIDSVTLRTSGDDNAGDEYAELLKILKLQAKDNFDVDEVIDNHKMNGIGDNFCTNTQEFIDRTSTQSISYVLLSIGDGAGWGRNESLQDQLLNQISIVLDVVGSNEKGILETTTGLQAFLLELSTRQPQLQQSIITECLNSVNYEEEDKCIRQIAVLLKVFSTTDIGSMITLKIFEFLNTFLNPIDVNSKHGVYQAVLVLLVSDLLNVRFIPEVFAWINSVLSLVIQDKRKECTLNQAIELENEELRGFIKDCAMTIIERIIHLNRKQINSRLALFPAINVLKTVVDKDSTAKEIIELWNEDEEKLGIDITTIPKTKVGIIKSFNPRVHEVDTMKQVRDVKRKIKKETRKVAKMEEDDSRKIMTEKNKIEDMEREKQKKAYGKILNELQNQQSDWKKFDKKKSKSNYKKKIRY
ncbi:Nuclease sbcCD subunit C [Entamoeba marina]